MIPAFDSWFGTIPFQSLKRTTRTVVTAKENLLLGALVFRGTNGLKLAGGSSARDGAQNYKGGKLHLERAKRMNTRAIELVEATVGAISNYYQTSTCNSNHAHPAFFDKQRNCTVAIAIACKEKKKRKKRSAAAAPPKIARSQNVVPRTTAVFLDGESTQFC